MRADFEEAGVKMAVVSAIDTGAQDFLDTVWTGGDLYIDSEMAFKKALSGGREYSNIWLLRPSVLFNAVRFSRSQGSQTNDLTDPKTKLLGGALVVSKEGKVLYQSSEGSNFSPGSAADILSAVTGKKVEATPSQETTVEACSR